MMTRGQWGDDNKTESALELCLASPSESACVSLIIVPQASVLCKAKAGGKGVSYRALASSREAGERLYGAFVAALDCQAAAALRAVDTTEVGTDGKAAVAAHAEEMIRKREAALTPPEHVFRIAYRSARGTVHRL